MGKDAQQKSARLLNFIAVWQGLYVLRHIVKIRLAVLFCRQANLQILYSFGSQFSPICIAEFFLFNYRFNKQGVINVHLELWR